jgi:DNA polymerase-3 subunit alpha
MMTGDMMFTHLHTHSHYSFLEGLASPAALAQAAVRQGMPALALTDHLWLTGAVAFYDACREAGVKPILGLEVEVSRPAGLAGLLPENLPGWGTLALLATDMQGWASLCRLSSAVLNTPDAEREGRLDFERLAEDTQGLICLTGGRRGLLDRLAEARQARAARRWLQRLGELFPERLYVELESRQDETPPLLGRLAALGSELKIPAVATQNVYYLTPEEAGLQRLAAAIRLNRPLADLRAEDLAPPGAYFTTPTEMEARFKDYPQALAATMEVVERCHLELPLDTPHFPELSLPAGESLMGVLRREAEAGARSLYGPLTPALQSRLDHELAVIEACGYAALFLVMQEIIAFARQSGIPISSRGSAASSLVAHSLGITSPDPLGLNLYFERFLNPARATPPDIDTDLCSRRRDEVIQHVYQRYGQERVAMVSTINRFRRRSALRETAKAYGLSTARINALVKRLPSRSWGPPRAEAQGQGPYEDLSREHPQAPYPAIFQQAVALIGVPRHLSIHPGGVVIAPGPITDLAPLQMAPKGLAITQFDLESIERLGLVKIDLLGIRSLTVLGDVAQALHTAGTMGSPSPSAVLENIPLEDPATASLVREGRTIGCFQIESPGMRATLREIQAGSVDDIMVALALYRPGPLTGGLKTAFVRRHRGQEAVRHLHPALAPLLEDTYGVILYQEQVLRIAHELAGLSLADADLLRRAMSHFDPGQQMQTLKEKFISGAAARSGLPQETAERVWELMAAFAGYGFPKAHAASYAQVAWRAAWCKAHHPAIFMTAVLANWGGYYPQRSYLTEARRMGLSLRPPHVNHARREFSLSYIDGQPVLFMGLNQVRELTRRTQKRILRERPFGSLADFLARVDPRPAEAENLALAGALEGMGAIPALLRRIRMAGWQGGQLPLFPLAEEGGEAWPLERRVAAQEAVLGVGVEAHPLELYEEQIQAAGAITTVEAIPHTGERLRLAGVRQTWPRRRGGRGEAVYALSVDDLEGTLEVVIPGALYRKNREPLNASRPFIFEGVMELDGYRGEPFLRVEKLWEVAGEGKFAS